MSTGLVQDYESLDGALITAAVNLSLWSRFPDTRPPREKKEKGTAVIEKLYLTSLPFSIVTVIQPGRDGYKLMRLHPHGHFFYVGARER